MAAKIKSLVKIAVSGLSYAGLVLTLLLSKANPYYYPPNRDSGLFLYTARTLLNGKLLYRYVWDNKPPGIFYLNALGLWLGKDTSWGVWIIELIFLCLTTWISFKLLKKKMGFIPALLGTLFWAWAISPLMITGNIMEEYPLLFSFLAVYWFCLSEEKPQQWIYPFLIGTSAAFNFLIRPNIIGAQAAIALVWAVEAVFQRDGLGLIKRGLLSLAGLIVPLAITAGYFAGLGTLNTLVEASILYNFSYTGGHANLLYSLGKAFAFLGPAAWVSLALYVLVAGYTLFNWKQKEDIYFSLLILILWPVEIILSILSGRAYEHYFVSWAPPLALICASASLIVLKLTRLQKIELRLAPYGTWILAGVTAVVILFNFQTVLEYRRAFLDIVIDHSQTYEKDTPIKDYLHDHTRPDDKILIWGGQEGINYMAHRDTSTAYVWYPLYIDSPFTAQLNARFLSDLENNKPTLIVDSYPNAPQDILAIKPSQRQHQLSTGQPWLLLTNQTSNLQEVFRVIDQSYAYETTVDGYDIYRLKTGK